jgi:nucleotide-binding universal stress UspA family protein
MPDTKIAKPAETQVRHQERATLTAEAQALRILAAVDGSQSTSFVLKRLVELNESGAAIDVVLLNVQPRPQEWRLRGYQSFKRKEIEDRLINDLGCKVVASAARQLDAVGISHRHRIELGNPAEVIVRCARDEGCDMIMLAEPLPGTVRRWLMTTLRLAMGSTVGVVVHLSPMPVLVAK